ncbi:hypothetical protein C5167_042581 [Papaver somniferum]|uniref:Target of rapamycin complex subunit LST8 n=1 Tax=Papaver somniferum TaxID=3469 RepID=A0A4Y7L755_PAPSO|nr:hypothetical protein C5167_042581 [Papaver somniferum]
MNMIHDLKWSLSIFKNKDRIIVPAADDEIMEFVFCVIVDVEEFFTQCNPSLVCNCWKFIIGGTANIRVWDLIANSCSCELVPEVDTAVRSVTVMWDESLVVAANNNETCYVWRLQRGTQTMTNFEPLHKLQAHDGYILKCLLSPGHIARASIIFIVDEGENSVKAQVFI